MLAVLIIALALFARLLFSGLPSMVTAFIDVLILVTAFLAFGEVLSFLAEIGKGPPCWGYRWEDPDDPLIFIGISYARLPPHAHSAPEGGIIIATPRMLEFHYGIGHIHFCWTRKERHFEMPPEEN